MRNMAVSLSNLQADDTDKKPQPGQRPRGSHATHLHPLPKESHGLLTESGHVASSSSLWISDQYLDDIRLFTTPASAIINYGLQTATGSTHAQSRERQLCASCAYVERVIVRDRAD